MMKPYLDIKFIVIFTVIFLVSGCQTMTSTECEMTNWTSFGEQDALKGYSSKIDSRVKACQKNNIAVDAFSKQLYYQGYQNAILQYCQPENIYELSKIGLGRISACPEPNYSQVKRIYQLGSSYYENGKEIKDINEKIQDLDDKIDRVTDKKQRYDFLEEQRSLTKKLKILLEKRVDIETELQEVKPKKD